MTTSGEGPESTQLKFRRKLKANLSPSLRAGVDIRGIRRSPVIPVELRIRCHYDGTRHIWDSPSAKHRYGRSECQHEAKPESIRVGGPGPSGRDWRRDGDRAPLRRVPSHRGLEPRPRVQASRPSETIACRRGPSIKPHAWTLAATGAAVASATTRAVARFRRGARYTVEIARVQRVPTFCPVREETVGCPSVVVASRCGGRAGTLHAVRAGPGRASAAGRIERSAAVHIRAP